MGSSSASPLRDRPHLHIFEPCNDDRKTRAASVIGQLATRHCQISFPDQFSKDRLLESSFDLEMEEVGGRRPVDKKRH